MSYHLSQQTIDYWNSLTDEVDILTSFTHLLAGVQTGLFVESGSELTVDKANYLIEAWDSLFEGVKTRLGSQYSFPEQDLPDILDAPTIAVLDSGDIATGSAMLILAAQRVIQTLLDRGTDPGDDVPVLPKIISYFEQLKEVQRDYGEIYTAEVIIAELLAELVDYQTEIHSFLNKSGSYVTLCNSYTTAVIDQPGYLETVAFRDLVVTEHGSLSNISSDIDSNILLIESYQASLGGSANLTYLDNTRALHSQSITEYSNAVALDSSIEDNKNYCIEAATNGYLYTKDFLFAPSEKIRITAKYPGPNNIAVSYAISNNVPEGAVSLSISEQYIQLFYNGGNPPFVKDVVLILNNLAGHLIGAVNLNLSGADGFIKANQSFIKTPLEGLHIT